MLPVGGAHEPVGDHVIHHLDQRPPELGAEQPDGASYVSLARYHWGVALAEGRGVDADPDAARAWLERAAAGGQQEAAEYLMRLDATRTTE
mgnify:CR=1 FL=1